MRPSSFNPTDLNILQQKQILIADDDAIILLIYRTILEFYNLQFTTVDDGSMVIKELQNKTYDVLFIDWNMPELSGADTIKEVLNLPIKKPFIVLSTSMRMSECDEIFTDAPIDFFIHKPISETLITEALMKFLYK